MIYYAYRYRSKCTPLEMLLALISFLDITFFFFYSFTDICFDTIVSQFPIPMMATLILYLVIDVLYGAIRIPGFLKFSAFNFIITVVVILSWISQNKLTVYFGAIIYLRAPQIMMFYIVLQEKLRAYYVLYRLLIIFRLLYLMLVIGQVLGCIFYLIDTSLIQAQYFQPITEVPGNYYQGEIVTFTPIYGLPDHQRYIYAMYYIYSLLSTIAYGDIIPKNWIQNAYVIVLLITSLFALSLIIEEMIMVFRRNKQIMNEIIKKVKYLNQMIIMSSVKTSQRYILMRYLISSLWDQTQHPDLNQLTIDLRTRLRLETVCNQCQLLSDNSYKFFSSPIKKEREQNLGVHVCMPLIVSQHLLFEMTSLTIPAQITIVDNNQISSIIVFYILCTGKLKFGYADQYLGSKQIKGMVKGVKITRMIGWEEMLAKTRIVHPYLKIKTLAVSTLYMLPQKSMQRFLQKYRNEQFGQMNQIEKYAIAWEESLFVKKYQCLLCSQHGHHGFQCPLSHYRPKIISVLDCRKVYKRIPYIRKLPGIGPQKIMSQSPLLPYYQEEVKVSLINNFISKRNTVYQQYEKIHGHLKDQFQQYEQFSVFHPEYNL